jgi:hypothetical protein
MFLGVDISLKLNIPEGMSSRGRMLLSQWQHLPRDEASRGDISTGTMWFRGVVVSPETNILLKVIILLIRGELSCGLELTWFMN